MNKSKTKKNIKVRDLKPAKDAKGGGGVHNLGTVHNQGVQNLGTVHNQGVHNQGSQGHN